MTRDKGKKETKLLRYVDHFLLGRQVKCFFRSEEDAQSILVNKVNQIFN